MGKKNSLKRAISFFLSTLMAVSVLAGDFTSVRAFADNGLEDNGVIKFEYHNIKSDYSHIYAEDDKDRLVASTKHSMTYTVELVDFDGTPVPVNEMSDDFLNSFSDVQKHGSVSMDANVFGNKSVEGYEYEGCYFYWSGKYGPGQSLAYVDEINNLNSYKNKTSYNSSLGYRVSSSRGNVRQKDDSDFADSPVSYYAYNPTGTLHVVYRQTSVVLTFTDEDDTEIDTTSVSRNSNVTEANVTETAKTFVAAKENKIFTGWTPTFGTVTENTTYKANYRTVDLASKQSATYDKTNKNPYTASDVNTQQGSGEVTYVVTKGSNTVYAGSAIEDAPMVDAGDYVITVKYTENGKTITDTETFTVSPKATIVTVTASSKVYGEADPTPVATYSTSGVEEGDDLGVVISRSLGDNAGSYPYTVTASNTNYSISVVYVDENNKQFVIEKKAVDVSANDYEYTYGETPEYSKDKISTSVQGVDVDYTVTDKDGKTVTLSNTTPAGTYTVTPAVAQTEGNYKTGEVKTGTVTVTKQKITGVVNNIEVVYGTEVRNSDFSINTQLPEGLTVTYKIKKDSEEVELIGNYLPVGTYTIVGSVVSSDYDVAITPGTLTVSEKEIEIVADNQSIRFGDKYSDITLTAALAEGSSFVGNDANAVTISTKWLLTNTAGVCTLANDTYSNAIAPVVENNGQVDVLANYKVKLTNGALSVVSVLNNATFYLLMPGKNIAFEEPKDTTKYQGQDTALFVTYATGKFSTRDNYRTLSEGYGINKGYGEPKVVETTVEDVIVSAEMKVADLFKKDEVKLTVDNEEYTFGGNIDWYVIKNTKDNGQDWHIDGVADWTLVAPTYAPAPIHVTYAGKDLSEEVKKAIADDMTEHFNNKVSDVEVTVEDEIRVPNENGYTATVTATYTADSKYTAQVDVTYTVIVDKAKVYVGELNSTKVYDGTTLTNKGNNISLKKEIVDETGKKRTVWENVFVDGITHAGIELDGKKVNLYFITEAVSPNVGVQKRIFTKDLEYTAQRAECSIETVEEYFDNVIVFETHAGRDEFSEKTPAFELFTDSVEASVSNYSTVEITPADALSIEAPNQTYTYNGSAQGAAAKVVNALALEDKIDVLYNVNGEKDEKDELVWTSEVPTLTNVGTITVTVKAENDNYVTKEETYTITINAPYVAPSTPSTPSTPATPATPATPVAPPVAPVTPVPAVVTPVAPTPVVAEAPVVEIEEVEAPLAAEIEEAAEVEIEDEAAPLAAEVEIEDEDTPLAAGNCFIHWIILLITLVYAVYAVVRAVSNKREMEDSETVSEN